MTVPSRAASLSDTKVTQALAEAEGNKTLAAKILGLSRSALHRRLNKMSRPDDVHAAQDSEQAVSSYGIKSVEEMVEAHNIDLEQFMVSRYKPNSWVGYDGDRPAVFHQTTLFLLPRPPQDPVAMKRDIIEEIKLSAPKLKKLRRSKKRSGLLWEPSIYDFHLGKYASVEETGDEGSMRRSLEVWEEITRKMLDEGRSLKPEQILFAIGNDFLNIDNLAGTTTAGTPQDNCARMHELVRQGRLLLREFILEMRELAPVHVVGVPGNHDYLSTLFMAEILDATFGNDPEVTVNSSPDPIKYHRYGTNLIGLTHGKEIKPVDLPLLMADDRPVDWAECNWFEWHLGHFHKHEMQQYGRVLVRRSPSLSPRDFYHRSKGFPRYRAAETFVYQEAGGQIGNSRFFIDDDMVERAGLSAA